MTNVVFQQDLRGDTHVRLKGMSLEGVVAACVKMAGKPCTRHMKAQGVTSSEVHVVRLFPSDQALIGA
eukprot:CAMPEP_0169470918 /NCGR_PEP_ID=MMETSP1042-20121227/24310_1 /TAXON_ID=464988 /ORGANISM="Hemiselmis andersenii, Strain CCMP1180" /LENGTH=67 /DNA_ID=CAMNT_0009584575 /DNA_START=16 /DNA_END=215 /DNA_ORIENTATION=+